MAENIDLTKRLPRGAIPSPRHELAAAKPHVPNPKISVPSSFLMWPVQMSSWNNYTYGDCVSAEEAFAKATAAPQTFVPEATAVAWASVNGYLNGAIITAVMTTMQSNGFPLNYNRYDDGPYNSVDWTNAATLQSAIYSHGPVKIGVGAGDFQSNANGLVTPGTSGWAMYNYPRNEPEDHCVSICGYGTLAELVVLFQQHGVTVHAPNGMPTGLGYAIFTWNSIGIIDQQSMLNMTYEAWIRNPVTIIVNTDYIVNKTIITSDMTPKAPSIASLNGCLYIAWKGDGNDNLNVMYSADNGATFGHKYTSSETSPKAPAICAHNGNLYIAWKGDGNDSLNVAQVVISGNNITGFANKRTLGDTSSLSPALASFGGRLYIAWKGDGNDNLNVMYSADDGTSFGHKYTSPETSPQPPGLGASGSTLFITWKGDGNDNLNVAQVAISGANVTGFANKVVLGDTSPLSPSLTSNANKVYLSWKGDGNDSLNVMYSTNNGLNFGNKGISRQTSSQPTSLCVHNGIVCIAWKGDGNDYLNVAQVNA
jgi:hypothetical protein